MEMVFAEGNIAEEKVFDGVVLPKTLLPSDQSRSSVEDLVMGIKMNKDSICEMLRRHGAVLFRGFEVDGGSDFRRVVEEFGWDDMPYLGPSPRVKINERVFTANEAPLHIFIIFHHEMSLMKSYPSKIFFSCETPPMEGGQTSLARSHNLLQQFKRQQPEFVQKLVNHGLLIDVIFPMDNTNKLIVGKSLFSMLGTKDQVEAEKHAKERMECSSVTFMEDGNAKVTFGPFNAIRTLQGEEVLFYFHDNPKDIGFLRLGDGSIVPKEVMRDYTKIVNEISVDITWHKGDVLLVDNLSTQHARRPGKPPRKVLVSICK